MRFYILVFYLASPQWNLQKVKFACETADLPENFLYAPPKANKSTRCLIFDLSTVMWV